LLHVGSAGNASNIWDIRLTAIVLEVKGWGANVAPARQTVPPGAGAGWNITLVNRGNLPRVFTISIDIPGGLLTQTVVPRNITVPPFENRTERLAGIISSRAAPGTRAAAVRISFEMEDAVFNVTIEVLQVFRVELGLDDEWLSSPAGVSFPVKLTVSNGGNGMDICEVWLKVAVLACGCSRTLVLEPFSSRNITLPLRVPSEASTRGYRLDALVISSGGPRDSREAILTVTEKPPYLSAPDLLVMLVICLLSALSSAAHERLTRPGLQEKK